MSKINRSKKSDIIRTETHKTCCTCKQLREKIDFYKDKGQPDGLEQRCKECRKKSVKNTWKIHSKVYKISQKKWRCSNREKSRAVERKSYKKLSSMFPERYRDKMRRRQEAIRRAIPSWESDDDRIIIKELYRLSNCGMHLDHIIPLQHELVCGLHTPNNLQVIDGKYNTSKNNRLDLNSIPRWPQCEWPRKVFKKKKT